MVVVVVQLVAASCRPSPAGTRFSFVSAVVASPNNNDVDVDLLVIVRLLSLSLDRCCKTTR